EAEFPQDEVRLARSLAPAELVGRQAAPDGVAAGQAHDGFRGVSLVAVDEFVAGGSAGGMVGVAVQGGERLGDGFLLQTWRDRLRHDRFLVNPRSTGSGWASWLAVAFIL